MERPKEEARKGLEQSYSKFTEEYEETNGRHYSIFKNLVKKDTAEDFYDDITELRTMDRHSRGGVLWVKKQIA